MKVRKFIFLFLGLALPVLVFVFLKLFGKNQFEVPLLYENGVETVPAGCNFAYGIPYVVDDSVRSKIGYGSLPLVVLNFQDHSRKLEKAVMDFGGEVLLVERKDMKVRPEELELLKKCVFLLDSNHSIILVDQQNRIRGAYDTNLDELDRLVAEMRIILKRY
jgi:hypothetical protein